MVDESGNFKCKCCEATCPDYELSVIYEDNCTDCATMKAAKELRGNPVEECTD